MRNRVIALVIDVLILASAVFFSMISPYRYEWDESLRQIDPDAVAALIFLWGCLGLFALGTTIFKNKTNIHILEHKNVRIASAIFEGSVVLYCIVQILKSLSLIRGITA